MLAVFKLHYHLTGKTHLVCGHIYLIGGKPACLGKLVLLKSYLIIAVKLAEESAENYQADLQRKMGLLDYAMLTASKSKRPADWKKFEAAVALAKAEPQRVASREGFKSAAEELAVYAEHLENVVRQGKAFTELLVKRTLRNKSISDKNAQRSEYGH